MERPPVNKQLSVQQHRPWKSSSVVILSSRGHNSPLETPFKWHLEVIQQQYIPEMLQIPGGPEDTGLWELHSTMAVSRMSPGGPGICGATLCVMCFAWKWCCPTEWEILAIFKRGERQAKKSSGAQGLLCEGSGADKVHIWKTCGETHTTAFGSLPKLNSEYSSTKSVFHIHLANR